MEERAVLALKSLEFLIASFPADDETHKEMRESFVASVTHIKALQEVLKAEEKAAFDNAREKIIREDQVTPEMCPCKSKECMEDYAIELSEAKKKQLIKEALIAKRQLEESLSELNSQLSVLQPVNEVVSS
jgi:hypothetical protein